MPLQKFTICSVASEVDPFVKTGGLADVARALPRALASLGHQVTIFIPLYRIIDRAAHRFNLIKTNCRAPYGGQEISFDIYATTLDGGIPAYGILAEGLEDAILDHAVYNPHHGNKYFALFNRCVLAALKAIPLHPDIIHCHDWHTGLIPYFLHTDYARDVFFASTATVFTIHNLAFQCAKNWWEIPPAYKDNGCDPLPAPDDSAFEFVNFTKRAIRYADIITTVSEWYAEEILTKEFGEDLHRLLASRKTRLVGIINGIDYQHYNPRTDPGLWQNYDIDSLHLKGVNKRELQRSLGLPISPHTPLYALISRLSEQKGLELLIEIMEPLLRLDLQLVILGSGDKAYEKFFERIRKRHATKVAAHLEFDTINATRVCAGSDMFLMPSRFEPCGLGQLISLRYGSIPIVHSVGGLKDTVVDFNPRTGTGNGFVFRTYDSRDLLVAITRAQTNYRYPTSWQRLVQNGMRQVYSWELPALKYIKVYHRAMTFKKTYHGK
ncbi:MAG: glycogen/starch synthase [Patescibacteria group bacterium]